MARIGGSLLEVSPCLPEFLPYLSEKHSKGFACCDAERLMGNGPLCCGQALVWTGWCGVGIVEQLQRGLKGHPFTECITLEQLWLPWQTALKVEIGRNWRGCSHFLVTCYTAVPHRTVSPHHLREARTSGMAWGKTATKAARIVSLRSVTLFPLRQKHRSSAPHPSGHTEVIHCHGLAQTQKLASVIVAIRVHATTQS